MFFNLQNTQSSNSDKNLRDVNLIRMELKFYKDFFNYGWIKLKDDATILSNEFSENFIKDLILNYFIFGNTDTRLHNIVIHTDNDGGSINQMKTIDFEYCFRFTYNKENITKKTLDFLFKDDESLILKEKFCALVITRLTFLTNFEGYK